MGGSYYINKKPSRAVNNNNNREVQENSDLPTGRWCDESRPCGDGIGLQCADLSEMLFLVITTALIFAIASAARAPSHELFCASYGALNGGGSVYSTLLPTSPTPGD